MSASNPIGKPWRVLGTQMRPGLLLMCKLLYILMLAHGFYARLEDPFVPFVPALDLFNAIPGVFEWGLKIAFLGAGVLLLFNVRVRAAALVLGVAVMLVVLASKPGYRNHIFIVGCLFFLAGLHRRDEEPWLLYAQMVVIYAGAFLNKVLDPDWWSGQFIHNWLQNDLANRYYEVLSPLFPGQTFAAMISWGVIASELALAALFAVRKWHKWAVGGALAMHGSFLLAVGRRVFGHFTEDVMLAMLAFLHWPGGTVAVRAKRGIEPALRLAVRFANWDGQFRVGAPLDPRDGAWFSTSSAAGEATNWGGLIQFLKYNTAFYVSLFFAYNGIAFGISRIRHFF